MANDSGKRVVAAGTEWNENRLIDVHLYIDRDESEGCDATFGHGLSLDERRSLLRKAVALLAQVQLPDPPPDAAD
jgi:hypothetical protein